MLGLLSKHLLRVRFPCSSSKEFNKPLGIQCTISMHECVIIWWISPTFFLCYSTLQCLTTYCFKEAYSEPWLITKIPGQVLDNPMKGLGIRRSEGHVQICLLPHFAYVVKFSFDINMDKKGFSLSSNKILEQEWLKINSNILRDSGYIINN